MAIFSHRLRVHASSEPRLLLAIAAGMLVFSVGVAGRQSAKAAPVASVPQTKDTKDAVIQSDEELSRVGEATIDKTCNSQCHGLEALDIRRTAREWNDIVSLMATKGASATDKEFAIIKQYLKRYDGIVAVNTAPAEELSAVLGFSTSDAQAIVEYRTAHGKFADAAALAKVPGIDKSRIEEQPDALRFQ